MSYNFTLDGRKPHKKFTCPQCRRKNLVRYYNPQTGEYFESEQVGKCDHLNTCGYHLTPREHNQRTGANTGTAPAGYKPVKMNLRGTTPAPVRYPPENYTYFKREFVETTLTRYEANNLVKYLSLLFGEQLSGYLVNRYRIGTSHYLPGTPVFWYIDFYGRYTAGKVIYYPDPLTGERYKAGAYYNGKPVVNWVHSITQIPDFKKKPCFFGEHLLREEPGKPVIIVESEKTALIVSVFFPDHIVIATGSMEISNRLYWELLRDRRAVMIPDFSNEDKAFHYWVSKAEEFNRTFKIALTVADYNESIGEEEKRAGADIADILTKDRDPEQGFILYENSYPIFWEFTIRELEGKPVLTHH